MFINGDRCSKTEVPLYFSNMNESMNYLRILFKNAYSESVGLGSNSLPLNAKAAGPCAALQKQERRVFTFPDLLISSSRCHLPCSSVLPDILQTDSYTQNHGSDPWLQNSIPEELDKIFMSKPHSRQDIQDKILDSFISPFLEH